MKTPIATPPELLRPSAGRRRSLLRLGGLGLLGAGATPVSADSIPDSWKTPGTGFSNYGQPSPQERETIRWMSANPAQAGEGVSWTPLHRMEGTITPNGLHFERHHNGVPAVDAAQWSLRLGGGTAGTLTFGLEDLRRYPLQSRITFIECGGNSNALWNPEPVQAAAGHLHGLLSGCEWTGVPLSRLLHEAGIGADRRWLIADGLDASGVSVSLPLGKCLDDVLVALYQNGEALRPENGYPARLVVPGWEGILNVKWLRSLTLSSEPLWSRFDTVSYTDLHGDGVADRMTFTMGVKSLITAPSAGQQLAAAGVHEVRGLAWSGAGRIAGVELSADGGRHWTAAILQEPVLDKALTRFRLPWHWDGRHCVLMSRATDETGAVQPRRQELLAAKGQNAYYHYNAICAWGVEASGEVRHVHG
ncbi:sulfite dehydrogenase [Granulosicoccus sp. 3-233]|uniref:sulfite dehydrogenase n=1 Tax=Granulosicoccus sp. 3-233 TaxID=3417969 RepID=UPI003D324C96